MNSCLKTLLLFLFVLCAPFVHAQELVVKSFTVAATDLSASSNQRLDLNGHPCGLVKVQLAVAGAQFEGNVIQPVERHVSEYWVYMTEGSKELKINAPGFIPLHVTFTDHQISGIVPKTTYVLTLAMPQSTAETRTQKLIINYTPRNAMVLIDSKPVSNDGHVEINLPLGEHSYVIAANGYATVEGTVKLNGTSAQRLVTENLEKEQTVAQTQRQQETNNKEKKQEVSQSETKTQLEIVDRILKLYDLTANAKNTNVRALVKQLTDYRQEIEILLSQLDPNLNPNPKQIIKILPHVDIIEKRIARIDNKSQDGYYRPVKMYIRELSNSHDKVKELRKNIVQNSKK